MNRRKSKCSASFDAGAESGLDTNVSVEEMEHELAGDDNEVIIDIGRD